MCVPCTARPGGPAEPRVGVGSGRRCSIGSARLLSSPPRTARCRPAGDHRGHRGLRRRRACQLVGHQTAEIEQMTTMVCFTAAKADYCVPVQVTRSVRTADGMISLPDPNPDVAGMIPGDPPLTVISPLHSDRGHILIIQAGEK